jgi:hypothetical protein
MPKKACCCNKPDKTAFCCDPIFFTDFITLYGDDMAQHAEVSPDDWVGLVVNRPPVGTSNFIRFTDPQITTPCNCCCNGCN